MNLFTKAAFATTLMATAIGAQAYNIIAPTDGTNVESLESIIIKFDSFDIYSEDFKPVTLEDVFGNVLSTGTVSLTDAWDEFLVTFSPVVTELGSYYLCIPENLGADTFNSSYEIVINLVAAEAKVPGVPTMVDPAPGDFVQSDWYSFDHIYLTFAKDKYLGNVKTEQIKLTNSKGEEIPVIFDGWWQEGDPFYEWGATNAQISVNFNNDGMLPSEVYTLTIPAGAIETTDGNSNAETLTYVYNYTKTSPDPDPTPLELTEVLYGGATSPYSWSNEYTWVSGEPFVEGQVIERFTATYTENGEKVPGSAFLLDFNHAYKTGQLTWELRNRTTGEYMLEGEACKTEEGKFIVGIPQDIKLLLDNVYELEFRAYSNNNWNKVQFGDGAVISFEGGMEPFPYSPYYFVASSPCASDDMETTVIKTRDEARITLVYSGPVKLQSATYNMGAGMSGNLSDVYTKSGNEYDAVWYVRIPDFVLDNYNSVQISMNAVDKDGKVVLGNAGYEETSCVDLYFDLTIMQTRLTIDKTNSHVPSLKVFRVRTQNGMPLNNSWMGYPALLNTDGDMVTGLNWSWGINEWGEPDVYNITLWNGEPFSFDSEPMELEFSLSEEITTPGTYTLHFPANCYALGTQFNGYSSVEQDFVFEVVPFVDVTYALDSHSVALPAVEKGRKATLDVTPAANWKLAELTLNGEDVTDDVVNGKYETPALNDNALLAARYEFDGAMITPTGADEIVSDLNLRAWSENRNLYVAGLKEGQLVNVYSIGGSLMASQTVGNQDTLEISVPEGIYVVTVTEGETTVALKLINK